MVNIWPCYWKWVGWGIAQPVQPLETSSQWWTGQHIPMGKWLRQGTFKAASCPWPEHVSTTLDEETSWSFHTPNVSEMEHDGTWWNPNMAILNGRGIKLICSEFQAIFPSTGTTCERFSIGCFANSFDTSRNRADQNNWDGFFIISWQVEVATKTTSSCLG